MGLIAALDVGGTATRAALYAADGRLLAEATGGPANPAAQSVDAAARTLAQACRELLGSRREPIDTAAAGIAGASIERVRHALACELVRACGARRALVADDLRPLLFANLPDGPGVVVVAGTGSSVLVRPRNGSLAIVGGKGPVLSDDGSGFRIAERALRAAAAAADGIGPPTVLHDALLAEVGACDYVEAAHWAGTASKRAVADLARAVADTAAAGDAAAQACITHEAAALANATAGALRRFSLDSSTPVFLNGSLFERCSIFSDAFACALEAAFPGIRPRLAPVRDHAATAALARIPDDALPDGVSCVTASDLIDLAAPTERRAASARHLDEMTPLEIVQCMNRADARCIDALRAAEEDIARVAAEVGRAVAAGGRLVYVGAGTSGRLGVLDASECPPTFGVSPSTAVGVMAGGDAALRRSCEDAEDDAERGAADVLALRPPIGARDVLVGIAASGTTPYVLGALAAAREAGVFTAMVSCNPDGPECADAMIVLDTGPEALPGSTRLKAGTATKMALNMISTGGMTLAGFVYKGLMVRVQATNAKLRARAVRIAAEVTGAPPAEVRALLEQTDYAVPVAALMSLKGWTRDRAERRLRETQGNLRAALDND